MDKGTILLSGFCFQHPSDHFQSGIPQALNASTGYTRIRIHECHNHALNAGLNDSFTARGCAALMTAGLERDDDRAALGASTGLRKRSHLGMSLPRLGMKAFARQSSLGI
jgi:hypothetical protein